MLIAIEGVDGAGTTTQARRLVAWLESIGRPAHLTREPTTGPIGELLRRVLGGATGAVDPWAVALLFAADRIDHLRREIEPAQAEGKIVISDRYVLSSLAYQTLAVPEALVRMINQRAPAAELTLMVEVPVEIAAARRRARGGPEELFDALEVQRRVAAAYREHAVRARDAGEPIVFVDGTPDEDTVFATLRDALFARLSSR